MRTRELIPSISNIFNWNNMWACVCEDILLAETEYKQPLGQDIYDDIPHAFLFRADKNNS